MYIVDSLGDDLPGDDDEVVVTAVARARSRVRNLLAVGGSTGPEHFHRELGEILYSGCGVTRTADGLTRAIERIRDLRTRFWTDLRVTGTGGHLNQELELAGRVADLVAPGDIVLVKGSKSSKISSVVDALRTSAQSPAPQTKD